MCHGRGVERGGRLSPRQVRPCRNGNCPLRSTPTQNKPCSTNTKSSPNWIRLLRAAFCDTIGLSGAQTLRV